MNARQRLHRLFMLLCFVVLASLNLAGCGARLQQDESAEAKDVSHPVSLSSAKSASPASTSGINGNTSSPQIGVVYATLFSIENRSGGKLITVRNSWKNAREVRRYFLKPAGSELPTDLADAVVVSTPVARFAATSSTHLPAFDQLGVLDGLTAFSDIKVAVNPTVRQRMKAGSICTLGTGKATMAERLAGAGATVLFASDFESEGAPDDELLAKLGVVVVRTTEFGEEHPLGRAEWLRFFSQFFDRDEVATRQLVHQAKKYQLMADLAKRQPVKPTVLLNAPFRGVWHVPGGRTFLSRLVADAGGQYLWAGEETSRSLPLQFEAVLAKAADADVWLHPGVFSSRAAAAASDDRFKHFQPWKSERMFGNDARVSPDGALDYWEEGLSRPDELLADFIQIIHPELTEHGLDKRTLRWHRRLP